jgi:hypothetical protein
MGEEAKKIGGRKRKQSYLQALGLTVFAALGLMAVMAAGAVGPPFASAPPDLDFTGPLDSEISLIKA